MGGYSDFYQKKKMPKVLTNKGFKQYKGLNVNYNTDEKVLLHFDNFQTLKCTSDHLLMMYDNSFKKVEDIEIDDLLFNKIKIVDKIKYESTEFVYDLIDVEDTNSYITNSVESHNCVLLDEFAFLQQGLAADFFQSTYPVISSGKTTKVIIVSTPNGLNLFYKMWVDAIEKRSLYIPSEIHWSQVPGRDAKWKEETIRNTSEHNFAVEFESVSFDTLINIDGEQVKIGDLYNELKQKNIN